jgi:hypothetical protein
MPFLKGIVANEPEMISEVLLISGNQFEWIQWGDSKQCEPNKRPIFGKMEVEALGGKVADFVEGDRFVIE